MVLKLLAIVLIMFHSLPFFEDIEAKDQSITLSGVVAHHQNGVAE
jgi:hypothetical protein